VKSPRGKERGTLFLTSVKATTKRERWIPITSRLLKVLEVRQHGPNGREYKADAYVFGNEVGEPRKDFSNIWGRVCDLAKITDLHFHDLRREAASRWLELMRR